MMIVEGSLADEIQTGGFETGKELRRAGNAAEGEDRAGDVRGFHAALQSPDWAGPAPDAEFRFEIDIVCRDGEDICPLRRMQCLTQVACREQLIVPIGAADEKNVDVAMELPMLETVIEDVDVGSRFRGRSPDILLFGTAEVDP